MRQLSWSINSGQSGSYLQVRESRSKERERERESRETLPSEKKKKIE